MSLSDVLAWKFDNAPGIRTREISGKMEIFDWPETLGPVPTKVDIAQWTGEYNARTIPPSREEALADAVDGAPNDAARWALLSAYMRGT